MPDFGTVRCDFPKGDAETLYKSVTEKLYTLPEDYVIAMFVVVGKGTKDACSGLGQLPLVLLTIFKE